MRKQKENDSESERGKEMTTNVTERRKTADNNREREGKGAEK
jgi:hypothetical protein